MCGCLCVYGPVVEDAEVMPNEPGIGSSNGRKLRHVTFKLELELVKMSNGEIMLQILLHAC